VAAVVDVLIKLIRLIAHLAMDPAEGAHIAAAPQSACLLRLLAALPLEPTSVGDAPPLCIEELQLNALSAMTNLSFYTGRGNLLGLPGCPQAVGWTDGTDPGILLRTTEAAGSAASAYSGLSQPQRALCSVLAHALTHPNPEAAAEAARALGNISRLLEARLALCDLLADEALLILLEHPSAQVRGLGITWVCTLGSRESDV
jgi:hypothetical protein